MPRQPLNWCGSFWKNRVVYRLGLSRTSSDHIMLLLELLVYRQSILIIGDPIIVRKTLINLFGEENAKCSVSNHQDQLNDFWIFNPLTTTLSVFNDIYSIDKTLKNTDPIPLMCGNVQVQWHKIKVEESACLLPVNVTMPESAYLYIDKIGLLVANRLQLVTSPF